MTAPSTDDGQHAAVLPCPSWIFASGSNTHVAKDRSWFGADYRPITSALEAPNCDAAVIGIGTVHLPVKTKPGTNHRGHGTLTLRNVLHVPSSLCNIIGAPVLNDHTVITSFGPKSKGSINSLDGSAVGYFVPNKPLLELRLSGPPIGPRVGPSPIEPNGTYWINACWSAEERAKWMREAASASDTPRGPPQQPGARGPSEEEKKWLKMHFDGEFHFLRCNGLNIHKDEDREEGWQIMRAMMKHEELDVLGPRLAQRLAGRLTFSEIQRLEDHHGDLETFMDAQRLDPESKMDVEDALIRVGNKMEGIDGDSEDSDFDWDNGAPETLLCNSYFEPDELKWVKAHYGDAMSFMLTMGLKFYNHEDGEEAAQIARSFMEDEPRRPKTVPQQANAA